MALIDIDNQMVSNLKKRNPNLTFEEWWEKINVGHPEAESGLPLKGYSTVFMDSFTREHEYTA